MNNACINNASVSDDLLLRLWGKSDEHTETDYHPLLFHLLDVGFCARSLWRDGLFPLTRSLLAEALCLPEEEAQQVCVLLAAQHDLGKASAFQLKPSVQALAAQARAAGFDIAHPAQPEQPHGYVTACTLPSLAAGGVGGWQAELETAFLLGRITGGHHGTFPTKAELAPPKMSPSATLGTGLWDEARRALLLRVQAVLFPNTPPVALPTLDAAALVPLVGGFVSVADWLGSSFSPSPVRSVPEYAPQSQEQAARAVRDFGWTARPQFAVPAAFGDIFQDKDGRPFAPNPMQQEVATRADSAQGPYLLIVEAAMGEGKTEAALYAIDRALTTHQASGFFLALPTQATGNAMFERVLHDYLKKRAQGGLFNFQLVHAGSWNSPVFDKLKVAANTPDREDEQSRIAAQQWFTRKKQALLAPFGVGTIDQSLLGVLQTRHWFVRLFGLAGKVVVFDEVHAYDVYMGTILARLLGWLRALGCTVVLLSATLPDSKRRDLVQAWDSQADVPDAEYPRVTFIGNGGPAQSVHVRQETVAPKEVHVSYADPELQALAAAIRADLPDGGCAAVICNTVARAQEAHRLLRDALEPAGWDVTLFHARTTANWRAAREEAVLAAFGKKSGLRPRKAILVATQVAEQSLDLDFDWMASDMAPADLLLQRLGRLWRHPRPERPAVIPRFVVLCGEGADGLPVFPKGTDHVYDEYVLLRSRHFLPPGLLALPGRIDPLVQAVYGGPDLPEGLSAAWQEALTEAKGNSESAARNSAAAARRVLVPAPGQGAKNVLAQGERAGDVLRSLYDDDDPLVHETLRAATREGDPSLTIVCAGTDANGWALALPPASIPNAKTNSQAHAEAARTMLGFAVSVSSQGLLHVLKKDEYAPDAWKDSPLLRYHRSLTFDNGACDGVPGYRLRLSQDVGLEIEKAGQHSSPLGVSPRG